MWRSLTQYHPQIGYTFIPGIRSRVPHESGGYLVQANEAGFRSGREYAAARAEGMKRALVFGDSQTAGDEVSNPDRYTDRLEKLLSGVEVYNYGLPGTGPDQHYLAYRECAAGVERDLVVIAVNVENILRVVSRFRPYTDEKGREVIYAKPYFELRGGELVRGHDPVPKKPFLPGELPEGEKGGVAKGLPFKALGRIAKALGVRELALKVARFQPLPQYDSADHAAWRLLRAILLRWIRECEAPVLLVPVPFFLYIEGNADPSAYQARYSELAREAGCHYHDPLADMVRDAAADKRPFRFKQNLHFTPAAHDSLARSLAPAVRRALDAAPPPGTSAKD
ncbi:MAG: SGNH/GDSL hydrolase family protein [Polyangiaceae bacterium]